MVGSVQNMFHLDANIELTEDEVVTAFAHASGRTPEDIKTNGTPFADAAKAINSGDLAHYNYVATYKDFNENDETGFESFIQYHDSAVVFYYNKAGPHVATYSILDHTVYNGGVVTNDGFAQASSMDTSTLFQLMTSPRTTMVIDKKKTMNMVKYSILCVMCALFSSRALHGSIIPDDITKYYKAITNGKLYTLELQVKLSIGLEAYPDDIIYINKSGVMVEDRGVQSFERMMSLEMGGQSLSSKELIDLILPLFHFYTPDFYGTIIDDDYFKWLANEGDKLKSDLIRLKEVAATPKGTCSTDEWVLDYYIIKFLNGSNVVIHYVVRGEQKTFHIKEISSFYLKDKFAIPPVPK
jgi:hypothetical protein